MSRARWLVRRFWRLLSAAVLGLVVILLAADALVSWRAGPWVEKDIAAVADMPVALVPGTARTHQGRPNQFYRARLEAAAALYKQGKVQGILVSGDNGSRFYNEPRVMRGDLIDLGVPAEHVTMDYAGFRTLDSVIRANKVFGLDRFLIVSQSFQAERGVFLARHHGIDARGFAASNPGGWGGFKVRLREILARVVAIWDLMTNQGPRFLGEAERVNLKGQPAPADSPAGQAPESATPEGNQPTAQS